MQPTSARDFLRVALQRLDVANEIMEVLRRSLEAQYIGGYSVECSLKALILEKTAETDRLTTLRAMTQGSIHHRPEVLLARLRDLNISLTPELAKRKRRFDWHTGLRYETGRKDTGETNALLTTAKAIYQWAEPQIT
jgi:HEPN domain-containing protein